MQLGDAHAAGSTGSCSEAAAPCGPAWLRGRLWESGLGVLGAGSDGSVGVVAMQREPLALPVQERGRAQQIQLDRGWCCGARRARAGGQEHFLLLLSHSPDRLRGSERTLQGALVFLGSSGCSCCLSSEGKTLYLESSVSVSAPAGVWAGDCSTHAAQCPTAPVYRPCSRAGRAEGLLQVLADPLSGRAGAMGRDGHGQVPAGLWVVCHWQGWLEVVVPPGVFGCRCVGDSCQHLSLARLELTLEHAVGLASLKALYLHRRRSD